MLDQKQINWNTDEFFLNQNVYYRQIYIRILFIQFDKNDNLCVVILVSYQPKIPIDITANNRRYIKAKSFFVHWKHKKQNFKCLPE